MLGTTVAAVSTPEGLGGIGVIRISGSEAVNIADKVFRSVGGKKLCDISGYSALFGKVFKQDEPIDEAVALLFKAPHSYTGEDVVEISVHGGSFVIKETLSAIFSAGALPAERGEFTKRAFLNGKLDLSEAEAVMDIISAEGKQALNAGLKLKDGALSKQIEVIRGDLLYGASIISAFSDFPDEEPEFSGIDKLLGLLLVSANKIKDLIDSYDTGKIIKDGINTTIVGSPNVGKSTLMNLLSGYDRSIVTSIAGTTRDVIEETVNVGGVVLHLADTAGLRETDDTVEKIGVERTEKSIESADLILAVVDGSRRLSSDEKDMLQKLKDKNTLLIINKSDLGTLNMEEIDIDVPKIVISAMTGNGKSDLEEAIKKAVGLANLSADATFISNERQKNCLERAYNYLLEAIDTINVGMTYDAVGVMLDESLAALLELTGERVTEEVANEVFSRFCVGK